MKTKVITGWSAGILAVGLVLVASAQEVPTVVPGELAAPATVRVPGSTNVSGWLADLIKLARAGIDENVMLLFIDTAGTFNADADNIIYLRDLGVSSELIGAMMRHDLDLALGAREVVPYAAPTTTSTPEVENLLTFLRKSRSAAASTSPAAGGATTPTKTDHGTAQPSPPTGSALATIIVPEPPASDNGSIVMDSGSPDVFAEWAATTTAERVPPVAEARLEATRVSSSISAALAAGRYPIREPYAVRLTNTFLIIQGTPRLPNLVIIEVSP